MKYISMFVLVIFLLSSCAPLQVNSGSPTSSKKNKASTEDLYADEPVFFTQETEVYGEIETRVSAYRHEKGKDDVISDFQIDLNVNAQIIEGVSLTAAARIQGDTANIHQGATLDNHNGKKTIMSMREMYVEFTPDMNMEELNIVLGKKIMQNAVNFDFAEFNPLARRNQSEPFSVMDDDTQDGVVVANVSMKLSSDANLFGECAIAGRNNPVTATNSNDHWTRDLPAGMSYGDVEVGSEVNYLCRMWQERDNGTIFEVAIFHGSGSGIDHVVSKGVELAPVFVKETSVSASAELTLGEWVTRLGCNAHFQESSDDFATCIVEVDRIWQFENGSSLFVEMGYINSFTTSKSDISISELDIRRSLDNHFVTTVEYSPSDGMILRPSIAKSLRDDDFYFRLEAEAVLDTVLPNFFTNAFFQNTVLTVRGEYIDGEQNPDGIEDIFGAHKDDKRVELIFKKVF